MQSRTDNARARRTAQLVNAELDLSTRRRRRARRLPKQASTMSLERAYARDLIAIVGRTREAMDPLLERLPQLLASAAADREPARLDAGEGDVIASAIDEIRDLLLRGIDPRPRLAEFAGQVSGHNREQLQRQARAAFGVDIFIPGQDVQALMQGFAAENVALIKDIPTKIIGDIERASTRAVASGTLHGDLAKEIEAKFETGLTRARLIARDQVGKLYGQINASRQKALGVEKFTWRSVGDERVRPEHEARDGEVYSYTDPPDGELPGQPILCRCYAEPVLDDLLN